MERLDPNVYLLKPAERRACHCGKILKILNEEANHLAGELNVDKNKALFWLLQIYQAEYGRAEHGRPE